MIEPPRTSFEKIAQERKILVGIVISRNKRHPYDYIGAEFHEHLKISVNFLRADSGKFLMLFAVDLFYIEQKQASELVCTAVKIGAADSAGLHCGGYALFTHRLDQCNHAIGLHCRLTARNRHSASGILVKHFILYDLSDDLIYRSELSAHAVHIIGTYIDAFSAHGTFFAVEYDPAVFAAEACAAHIKAASARCAFIRFEHKLGESILRFRIMAPKTSERTSFQKDVGAYSRTVVKAEFLNIEVRESQSFHPYRIRRFFLYLIDCSCYYVILEILGKIHKIIAVSAHAHYEIAVRVGVLLRVNKLFGRHDGHGKLLSAVSEIRSVKPEESLFARRGIEQLLIKFYVQYKSACRKRVVKAEAGFEKRRGAVRISAGSRPDGIGKKLFIAAFSVRQSRGRTSV